MAGVTGAGGGADRARGVPDPQDRGRGAGVEEPGEVNAVTDVRRVEDPRGRGRRRRGLSEDRPLTGAPPDPRAHDLAGCRCAGDRLPTARGLRRGDAEPPAAAHRPLPSVRPSPHWT
ncbi:hypothetical protein QJS66_17185 [Kocuria rhizophila]|nr:hypothetical protein QJS66_17185 [Kocuria rhizophila]